MPIIVLSFSGKGHISRAGGNPVEVAEVHGHGGLTEDGVSAS